MWQGKPEQGWGREPVVALAQLHSRGFQAQDRKEMKL